MVSAVLNGDLKGVNYSPHPIFQILVPNAAQGMPTEILNPQNTWSDPDEYKQQARELARRFVENFHHFSNARPEILAAGPIPV